MGYVVMSIILLTRNVADENPTGDLKGNRGSFDLIKLPLSNTTIYLKVRLRDTIPAEV